MHSYIAATHAEWSKLLARRKMRFPLLLLAVIPAAAAVLLSQLQSGIGIAAVSAGDFPVFMLSVFTNFVLPLFMFVAAADLFAGEIQDRTLKLTLIRPVSRFGVYISKLTALMLYLFACLAVGGVVSVVSGVALELRSGFGASLLITAEAYFAALLPMLSLALLAVLLSQLFRSASGALMVCVLIYAALKLLGVFLPHAAAYFPAAYTDWHQLWLNSAVSVTKIVNGSVYLIACCILCFTIAFAMFDRREL